MEPIDVLAVDDNPSALEDLAWLLRQQPVVRDVVLAGDATRALRLLRDHSPNAVFLDIHLPGLDGMELARVLGRFTDPPAVVFVTAFDAHAVEAFEVKAVDYLLKPVRAERLQKAIDRILDVYRARHAGALLADAGPGGPARIAVEAGGRTKLVDRADITFVEAAGDYARLHLASGASHCLRVPMSVLEERWASAGFARIHRSYLVALAHIEELRSDSTGVRVRIGGHELPASRRHVRELKGLLRPASEEIPQ